jgi:hypothetical protein
LSRYCQGGPATYNIVCAHIYIRMRTHVQQYEDARYRRASRPVRARLAHAIAGDTVGATRLFERVAYGIRHTAYGIRQKTKGIITFCEYGLGMPLRATG